MGQAPSLQGIICEPLPGTSSPNTAMILLNSGVIHRVGSCRLSVLLARAVCQAANIITVRFDFSGIGERCPPQRANRRRGGSGGSDRGDELPGPA